MSEWKMVQEKLRDLDKLIQETRNELDTAEMVLVDEPDFDRSDYLRLLGHLNDYRAMLSAAPQPTEQETTKRLQEALKLLGAVKADIGYSKIWDGTREVSPETAERIAKFLSQPTDSGREG